MVAQLPRCPSDGFLSVLTSDSEVPSDLDCTSPGTKATCEHGDMSKGLLAGRTKALAGRTANQVPEDDGLPSTVLARIHIYKLSHRVLVQARSTDGHPAAEADT